MKKAIIALLVLLISMPVISYAAQTTLQASVTIATPISITETTPLNFGKILIDTSLTNSLVATLDYNNNITITDGGISSARGAQTGVVRITGDTNTSVNVSVDKTINLTSSVNSRAPSLTVILSLDHNQVTLDSTGSADVKVKGSITIPNESSAGLYVGSYNVTAVY